MEKHWSTVPRAFIIPACGTDAPNKRERCAIVGYSKHNGLYSAEIAGGSESASRDQQERENKTGEPERASLRGDSKIVAYKEEEPKVRITFTITSWRSAQPRLGMCHDGIFFWLAECRRRWSDGTWEEGIQRIAKGIPDRVDKLKFLDNAVVPEQFYPIFKAIVEIESRNANC